MSERVSVCIQESDAGVDKLLSSLWQSLRTLKQVICSFQLAGDVHSQKDEIASLRDQVRHQSWFSGFVPVKVNLVKVKSNSHTRGRASGSELPPVSWHWQSVTPLIRVLNPAVGCRYFPPGPCLLWCLQQISSIQWHDFVRNDYTANFLRCQATFSVIV